MGDFAEDKEFLESYEHFIVPRHDRITYNFRTTPKKTFILRKIIMNKVTFISSLRKFFRERRDLEMFLLDLSEVNEIIKHNKQHVWLNPEWVEKENSLFKKKTTGEKK